MIRSKRGVGGIGGEWVYRNAWNSVKRMSDTGSRISNIASYSEIPRSNIGNVVLLHIEKVFILYIKVFSSENGDILLLSSCCLISFLLLFGSRNKGFQEFITEISG